MPARDQPPPKYLSQAVAGAFRDATEKTLLSRVRAEPIPRHVAIIMDGNRRFAVGHGLLVEEGHLRGKDKLEELLDWCLEIGIRILTVYALSTENLGRSEEELRTLMALFRESFEKIAVDERVHRYRIRVKTIGNLSMLPPEVQEAIRKAEAATEAYDDYRYNIAIAYGGREEIVEAIRAIARDVAAGRISPEAIDSGTVSGRLYTADMPDPDLVFRTSGEERISNFLLWQSAYAELYFADVMWPGLTKIDFLRAIRSFQTRQRRLGR
ncbi:MAG: polyprenyl diphosphate synthase [Thermoplasmata archaeon]|nr:polyprenyl diphosphate synthase [Thermoplasmata archaeon]MCI4359435.1 polyprenyl diphosphate synthase [Thermoplasmata archaeon]